MTELTPSTLTRRLDFARIIPTLFRPQQTFVEISAKINVSWLTPMLILSISSVLVVLVSGYLASRAAMMGEMQLPRDWEWWSPDMQANYMQAQQSMQGPVFAYIIPLLSALIGLWLGWLILSGLLHLGSTLLGGRGSMQGALNISGWASLPFLIRDILRIVFMLIAGQSITSPGLSGFAGSAAFAAQFLARVDIFFIWNIVLLVIGFGIGDSLPKIKAITNVVIITLLLLLLQSGIGALLSNASGLVVQRPFF